MILDSVLRTCGLSCYYSTVRRAADRRVTEHTT